MKQRLTMHMHGAHTSAMNVEKFGKVSGPGFFFFDPDFGATELTPTVGVSSVAPKSVQKTASLFLLF